MSGASTTRERSAARGGADAESTPSRGAAWARVWGRSQSLIPTLAAVALFIGMLVYAEIAYGRVFHLGTMSSLLVSFAPTIILAVAMTVVILSGGIDLSVGAVVAFTKALAKELGPSGIRVNCVAPGCIDTDMIANLSPEDKAELADSTALCRMGTAEDVGDAIALLASERARFVTGQVFGVDGGLLI